MTSPTLPPPPTTPATRATPATPATPATKRRGRRAWLVVAGLLGTIVITWGTYATASVLGREVTVRERTIEVAIDELEVHGEGTIRVVAGQPGQVVVTERIERSIVGPSRSQRLAGARLVLRSSCPPISTFCSVSTTVAVPPGTALRLHSDGGSIHIHDSRAAQVTARADGGAIDIELDTAPERVDVHASGGNVTVVVPRGETSYLVDARASGGRTRVAVRTDPSSPRTIAAGASGGNVTIRYP